MTHADAEAGVEMPQAMAEGSDQKSREYVNGVSNATAMKESSWTKARTRLMEQAVSRDNMMAAYHRVRSNKGASGIDGMTVGELKAHLVECWPRIREELLEGRYLPQPVRKVEIPKPGGGMRMLGIPTVFGGVGEEACVRS